MRVIDAVKETIADVSSVSPSSERMFRGSLLSSPGHNPLAGASGICLLPIDKSTCACVSTLTSWTVLTAVQNLETLPNICLHWSSTVKISPGSFFK